MNVNTNPIRTEIFQDAVFKINNQQACKVP